MPYRKCSKKGWCPTLAQRLHEANARRAGLAPVVVVNLKTGKDRCLGVAFRTGPRDVGLMLNACPWCAADLRPWHSPKTKARA